MPSNTNTLQDSAVWASLLTGSRPLALQGTLEPALTCANIIIQAMLAPPFKWPWNRNTLQFQTIDPANPWQGTFTYALGNRILDYNGNMETVTTAGTSGPNPPIWTVIPGQPTTDDTIIWTMSYASDYVQPVADFGFIELASLQDAQGNVFQIPNTTENLTPDSGSGRWQTLAPYLDDNNGNITFRAMPSRPDKLYTANVIYQKRAALLQAITDVWPIPDMYSNVYNFGFLGMVWLFANEIPEATLMLQKFAASVISISSGLTEQDKSSFMQQWSQLSASRTESLKAQQGISIRPSM